MLGVPAEDGDATVGVNVSVNEAHLSVLEADLRNGFDIGVASAVWFYVPQVMPG